MANLKTLWKTVRQLIVLLFSLATLLFILLRLTGDPTLVMAGPDATEEQIAAVEREYGFDRPLPVQYLNYMVSLVRLDFGTSLASGRPAIAIVAEALPITLLLTFLAMTFTILVSIPLGAWLAAKEASAPRKAINLMVFIAQGTPGFVAGLFLIQLLSVEMGWLPSIGMGDAYTWVLPILTLASFLIPKLVRMVYSNVQDALKEDYILTASAFGASPRTVLWRHALPNALLGTVALIGTQFAYLIGGSVIVETMFAWPGMGWHLLQATRTLDFPLVQALALTIAMLVFFVNAATEFSFRYLDPRLRGKTI